MDSHNLATRYDAPEMDWDLVRTQVRAATAPGAGGPGRYTWWLTTLNADGSPHTNALGALWHEDAVWFTTGRNTRRGHNLARDPRVTASVSVPEFDLVVEGQAEEVTDPEIVADMSRRWNAAGGWPCEPDESGTALTAPYSAQSAGAPPWHVYRVATTSAHLVATTAPFGAMRWNF
ncbi:pyridoxamine 5'-phosphate oxidase family protein [Myceligenerans indicum]|uniref:Pyridoxamine 5'-phosphate oxidase family protein n=1 Tax=Myceligenerans indicum TaxID=2593663 RepID=A0ABS1LR22_9MICO|nr:pyridoxamine 5'-phosphate oxidase family protein [Myceligenerans indicum]MBL0888228.1 pyridoxamine 5'-phosphate oxidase family protein [Myceligenerans indicum]